MEIRPTNNIKMIVIDIDGTLLDPEGRITERTRAAVQAARQEGIVVTLATARRYCNTVQIARELELECSLIVSDGAMIAGYPQAEVLQTHPMQSQVAQQAVELFVRNGLQPVVHPDTGLQEEIWTGPTDKDNLWLEAYFSVYAEQVRRMPDQTRHVWLRGDHGDGPALLKGERRDGACTTAGYSPAGDHGAGG